MLPSRKKALKHALSAVKRIIDRAIDLENTYSKDISKVHPVYRQSAANLVHYLAFRSFNINLLHDVLRDLGLRSLTTIEGHVLYSLVTLRQNLEDLLNLPKSKSPKGGITMKKSKKVRRTNSKMLFGYKSKKRRTRIMVTLPSTAADDPKFVNDLVKTGMNCARINCAHDDEEAWFKMAQNVHKASKKLNKKCKIVMDLGGPKLRTGSMIEGPKIKHIKPLRNDLGQVIKPALIWIAPYGSIPQNDDIDTILPVSDAFYGKLKRGSILRFTDSRNKKIKIDVKGREGDGRWGFCSDSAYIETGTPLTISKYKPSGKEISRVGELLPKEQFLSLYKGDILIIHKDPRPGDPAVYSEDGHLLAPAHISCTLPEVFQCVQKGETIYFDDGKIEGVINEVSDEEIQVCISQAKTKGSKLKADKGINLPESNLIFSGLTEKDKLDLNFVAQHADAVNYSFVNTPADVKELQSLLKKKKSKAGIILKIETQKAFKNLPTIILTAMRTNPIGVMIARGDLAIETGWKNFATIQQEIVRICGAAHIPDIWATQVLESLAKKGTPSRSEITDAALSQQAECVMLNKGYYILKAVKMLDKILRRMQRFQNKTAVVLPKLQGADRLELSHKMFDV